MNQKNRHCLHPLFVLGVLIAAIIGLAVASLCDPQPPVPTPFPTPQATASPAPSPSPQPILICPPSAVTPAPELPVAGSGGLLGGQ